MREKGTPLCGMGVCFECRVTKDGVPHVRSCMPDGPPAPPLPEQVHTLIVGAGPAGMAAAIESARRGVSVAVMDDNIGAGGQIWRRERDVALLREFEQCGASMHPLTPFVTMPAANTRFEKLILATGARELLLPFPGWTLPGVTGAGGLQALVKNGLAIAGKRVVVAGSGPLLLAVGAYLKTRGAEVLRIVEQAPLRRILPIGRHKPWQALALRWKLLGVAYDTGVWPIEAHGDGTLESIVLSNGERIACDHLAYGFGLTPNTELAELAGCAIENGFVKVNERQQTTVPHIYCAGEVTGIGGVDKAILEGRIAGGAASAPLDRSFVDALAAAFRLDPRLKQLARPDTIVCRCEEVTLAQLTGHQNWRAAKLQTRCGMGACQGRTCGPIVEHLLGWPRQSTRPPIFPATVGELLGRDRESTA